MSDSRLRELERKWRETGSVEAEATWIQERLRSEDLERGDFLLAVHLGHSASRLVFGVERSESLDLDEPTWKRLLDLFAAIPDYSRQGVLWRVALACSRYLLQFWDAKQWGTGPEEMVQTLSQWILSEREARSRLEALYQQSIRGSERGDNRPPNGPDIDMELAKEVTRKLEALGWGASGAVQTDSSLPNWPFPMPIGGLEVRELEEIARQCDKAVYVGAAIRGLVACALDSREETLDRTTSIVVRYARHVTSSRASIQELRHRIRDEVCPWILGQADPLLRLLGESTGG